MIHDLDRKQTVRRASSTFRKQDLAIISRVWMAQNSMTHESGETLSISDIPIKFRLLSNLLYSLKCRGILRECRYPPPVFHAFGDPFEWGCFWICDWRALHGTLRQ